MITQAAPAIEVQDIKDAARGRWGEIVAALTGIDRAVLDARRHGPCPKCAGTDRFRVFPDFDETGGAICNACFSRDNGDGFSFLQWFNGWTFPKTKEAVAGYLGVTAARVGSNGHAGPLDIIEAVCRLKRMPYDSAIAFGAKPAERDGQPVARFPMYNEQGEECSFFDLGLRGKLEKGLNAPKQRAGLFIADGEIPQPGDAILLVEGVKDAAALHGQNYVGVVGLPTCKLDAKFARLFQGCEVTIVPDRDTAGQEGAQVTAARLVGHAAKVRIATLPGELKAKNGDGVREILAKRDGSKLLSQALADAVEWTPSDPSSDGDGAISNAESEIILDDRGKPKTVWIPRSMAAIVQAIENGTGGWPRRVGESLFVDEGGICWLPKPPALFGWLGRKVGRPARFRDGDAFHPKAEVFAELQRTAQAYEAIEALPHEPPISGHYYACQAPEPGNGNALRKLAGLFCPETTIDGDLIQAAVATLLWGGPGGARPAFVILSDAGRGVGKSTMVKLLARIVGGLIDVSANEDIGTIKQRLLSPEALPRRIVLIDNVKRLKFSWPELESLITCEVVSGKRMYVGESSRPNTLSYFITLNGACLSTDLAQRCIVIKLAKPTHTASWETEARDFIDRNREAIIADAIALLRKEQTPLQRHSRWGAWESSVLSRLPDPSEAQTVVFERQAVADVEKEEAEIIEDHFQGHLADLRYDTATERIFIPTKLAADWFNEVVRERRGDVEVSRMFRQKIDEREFRRIRENRTKQYGRGFLWVGDEAEVDAKIRTDIKSRLEYRNDRVGASF